MELEGSSILEALAERGLVEEFYEAIDSDDVTKIKKILRDADIPEDKIFLVLQAISLDS